jgi:GNAT superfamily N-acetyltransferase
MKVIDLKKEKKLLQQYVDLRNQYVHLLLTLPVFLDKTEEWLRKTDTEVRGIVQDETLYGVAILYVNMGGEIAFFVREQNKGLGSQLLNIIETVAMERGVKAVWAWVLDNNEIAQKVFEKSGYMREERIEKKVYNQKDYQGIIYRKELIR